MPAQDLDRDGANEAGDTAAPRPDDRLNEIATAERAPAQPLKGAGTSAADEAKSPSRDVAPSPAEAAERPDGEDGDEALAEGARLRTRPEREASAPEARPRPRESHRRHLGAFREETLAVALEDAYLLVAHAAGRERAVSDEAVGKVVAASRAYTDRGSSRRRRRPRSGPASGRSRRRWSPSRPSRSAGRTTAPAVLGVGLRVARARPAHRRFLLPGGVGLYPGRVGADHRRERRDRRTLGPAGGGGSGRPRRPIRSRRRSRPTRSRRTRPRSAASSANATRYFSSSWDYVPRIAPANAPQAPGRWFWSATHEKRLQYEQELERWQEQQQTTQRLARDYSLAKAASLLTIRSAYVLPALYGLLGTVAFMLRSVSQGIRNAVLTKTATITYFVRMPLGMLARALRRLVPQRRDAVHGLRAESSRSRSPSSPATPSGSYFAAMDRLIGAFTAGDRRA